MKIFFFEILVLTALTVGLILELTPKSALLSLTTLYSKPIKNAYSAPANPAALFCVTTLSGGLHMIITS